MRATATRALTTLSLVGLLALTHGCSSQASAVCQLVCECEHCNDVEEERTCARLETRAEVADVYGCGAEWEAYATCVEDKGECDEEEASFSTQETSDGADRCQDELVKLGECQNGASNHGGGFEPGEDQHPEPG